MSAMDFYLMSDHSARRHTMYASIAMGAAAGAFAEWAGGKFEPAFVACVVIVGAAELVRAFSYVEPNRKKQVAIATIPVRRRFVLSAVSAAILLFTSRLTLPPLEALASERKLLKVSADPTDPKSIEEAKRVLAGAIEAKTPISPRVLEKSGAKFVNASASHPETWDAAIQFLDYKSSTANAAPRLGPLAEMQPSSSVYTQDWMANQSPTNMFVYGTVPQALAARYNRIGDERNEKLEFGDEFVVAEGGGQLLDNMHFKNVIFRDVYIDYLGSPVIMENVYFINCRFWMRPGLNGRGVALAILAPSDSTSYRGD
jgi:hypothetical protein